ncbi:MAG: YdcF family protein [Chthoniobacterales bacterium]|nr:YdcF family protein [Chthoniobacterales bacterium]
MIRIKGGGESLWTYFLYGPFADLASFIEWLQKGSIGNIIFSIVDLNTNTIQGMARFDNIDPVHGTIEIGTVMYAPAIQKTRSQDLIDAEILWNYHCRKDRIKKNKNSLIIGLGSYDDRVAAYCSELYLKGYGQKILFTGKFGNWTKGAITPLEAQHFAKLAIQLGVSSSDILLEKKATNIGENIIFSRLLIQKKAYVTRANYLSN